MISILNLLFPNRCLWCNSIIDAKMIICENCYSFIHFTHWEHLAVNPLKERLNSYFSSEEVFGLMFYEQEGLSQKIIHQLKYGGQKKIGKTLAKWCEEKISFKNPPNLLVTIPLHPIKEKKRGYNQLHLFADELSKYWKIPHRKDYLKRIQHNKAQAKKDRAHREKSVIPFALENPTSHQHILLIDDVCTTGNTLASCARLILENNNKISILVMAVD